MIDADTSIKIVKLKENDSFGKLTDNQGRHEVDFRTRLKPTCAIGYLPN